VPLRAVEVAVGGLPPGERADALLDLHTRFEQYLAEHEEPA
jgi:hypothetical protein